MKNTTQVEKYVKDPSYLNNTSNASATSTGDFSNYSKDTQHSRHNGSLEGDKYHKDEPSEGLPSHDILLDPGLISARLSRRAEEGDTDYSNPASIENISNDVKSNNYDESRSAAASKRSLNYKSDLGVAEDRYPPPYPYWNPYYYRGQYPNQGYRINDRREPYRNYWRYPVFPGK